MNVTIIIGNRFLDVAGVLLSIFGQVAILLPIVILLSLAYDRTPSSRR